MTKREAAIISAYTGIFIGTMEEYQNYVEEILDRPVMHHEMYDLREEIKEKAKPDFIELAEQVAKS